MKILITLLKEQRAENQLQDTNSNLSTSHGVGKSFECKVNFATSIFCNFVQYFQSSNTEKCHFEQ